MKAELSALFLDLQLVWKNRPLWLGLVLALLVTLAVISRPEPPAAPPAAPGDPRLVNAYRAFQQILIEPAALPVAQQNVLERARAAGLEPGVIDYAEEGEPAQGFRRAVMRLPVAGSYAGVREFIESALAQQPALAVRQLSIERPEGSDRFVRAEITLELLIAARGP